MRSTPGYKATVRERKSKTPNKLSKMVSFPKLKQKKVNEQMRGLNLSHERDTYKSWTLLHVGMKEKPLVPYRPGCCRSRLMIADSIVPNRNASSFEIGDKERYSAVSVFKTTYQLILDAVKMKKTNNPGIFAERTKWFKSRR